MSPAPIFDRALHRRRLERSAATFDRAGHLKQRAAQDIAERLAMVRRRFRIGVDLAARTGPFARLLAAENLAGRIELLVEADGSAAMLSGRRGSRLVLDEERLPFAPGALDLVVSSLGLHWANDLVGTLIQIRQALAPGGLFIGALIGGASLWELRTALTIAESELAGGAGPRISPLLDPADAPALLQRAGFAMPVVDVDPVRVLYGAPLDLLADLRAMGETSALVDRAGKPLTRAIVSAASAIYSERFGQPDGRVAATFEIITLTGWAPEAS